MSKKFDELPLAEQMEVAQKIGEALKRNDIKAKVDIYREEVCQLTLDEVKGRTMLKCEKSLPSTQAEQADAFNKAIQNIKDEYEGVQISVNSVIGVGDKFKTIEKVTTIEDAGTEVNIAHIPGKVMFIDFWATWCPPCQRPMQHNQDMLKEHGEKWGDNVQIIGLSIDGDAETVVNHVNNKGWTSVKHYHRAKSNCSDVYQVRGVPHVMILDKEGTIVFKGHPANRKDLVKDFNDLLEGKSLDGVEKPNGGGEGEEKDGDGKSVTAADIQAQMGAMDKFKDVGKELQTENKENATGMMRNFCVLTLEAAFDPFSEKWTSAFTNHRVLVGPKEKVDKCQQAIEAKLGTKDDKKEGWNFELNEQYHHQ